ncbi:MULTISPECIES: alpha/beta hydrolase [Brevibacterium]|uniref:Alpha/beta fold hydrolase n=1 Tax=Brevibacterium salitolerans TaxID=1403566 RepID=A0ABP5IVC3_9MICO|nr:alpha/beta fold hydrolase [Brevibacterium sp.]
MMDPHSPWLREGAAEAPAVLLLHGFTGSPGAFLSLADEFARDPGPGLPGITVSVPLLPGHGGTWQELARTGWDDWLGAALTEYDRLAAAHPAVVVAGLSMGGALACALGVERDPAALVLVNPALRIDSPLAPLLPVLGRVVPSIPAIGDDIAMPGVSEHAGDRTPLAALRSFHAALPGLCDRLWAIRAPVTCCLSGADSVVSPRSHRILRSRLTAPLTTVPLRRSRHVATVDYDAPVIADRIRRALGQAVASGAPGGGA